MSDSKPIASLGPLLLARKGAAKPALRSTLGKSNKSAAHLDADSIQDNELAEYEDTQDAANEPEIKRQQKQLVTRISDAPSKRGKKKGGKSSNIRAVPDATPSQVRRAAFTLRLDEERHLKLKLASAIAGASAQQLVTKALDQMLAEMPEIETLAAQVRRDGNKA